MCLVWENPPLNSMAHALPNVVSHLGGGEGASILQNEQKVWKIFVPRSSEKWYSVVSWELHVFMIFFFVLLKLLLSSKKSGCSRVRTCVVVFLLFKKPKNDTEENTVHKRGMKWCPPSCGFASRLSAVPVQKLLPRRARKPRSFQEHQSRCAVTGPSPVLHAFCSTSSFPSSTCSCIPEGPIPSS